MQKSILVTGGAGYVGSHVALSLAQQNYHVIMIDDLYHGQQAHFGWMQLISGDMGDKALVSRVCQMYQIDAVVNCAQLSDSQFAFEHPKMFYTNNVGKTLALLEVMLEQRVAKLVHASSCAVYEAAAGLLINEDYRRVPSSVYGRTKLAIEHAIEDYSQAYGLQAVTLRVGNVAGAWWQERLGEAHSPEMHLVPNVVRAAREGKPFTINGTNFDTPDGTAIRDFVHVRDVARAHIDALSLLDKTGVSDCFNISSGQGHSVKEVVAIAEQVAERTIVVQEQERREQDLGCVVLDSSKARVVLGWQPQYSDLPEIIGSQLQWDMVRLQEKMGQETTEGTLTAPST